MKTVLLYGDSILWGVNALTGKRHEPQDRLEKVLQAKLGPDVDVIAEGLRGRTMFDENGSFPQRNGLQQFGPIVASHLPVDILVIMLGANDANATTRHSGESVADALDAYVGEVKGWCDFMKYDPPELLVVTPSDVADHELVAFAQIFAGAAERITSIGDAILSRAAERGWRALDARTVCKSVGQDGVHLDAVETKKLALSIAECLEPMLATSRGE